MIQVLGAVDENSPNLPSDPEDNSAEQLGEDDIAEIYSPPAERRHVPRPQDQHELHAQTVR